MVELVIKKFVDEISRKKIFHLLYDIKFLKDFKFMIYDLRSYNSLNYLQFSIVRYIVRQCLNL